MRGKNLPRALVRRRIEIRAANGFKMPKRWAKAGWQQWQLDSLGTAPRCRAGGPVQTDGHGGPGDGGWG
jgi:hypothetical protein